MDIFRNLSKRERVLFILAATCISVAVAYRLVMIPVRESTAAMDDQIERLSSRVRILQTIASQKGAVDDEYERLRERLPQGDERDQLPALLELLELLSSQAGVALVDVKPRPVKDGDWFKTHVVELKVEGSVEQLMVFLHRLSVEPGAIRVDELQVSRKEKSAKTLVASMLASKMALVGPGTVAAVAD
jgi:Tfp pilus assembly protein PilO